jgi:hypothetical protein
VTGAIIFFSVAFVIPVVAFHVANLLVLVVAVLITIGFSHAMDEIAHFKHGRFPPGHTMALGIITEWAGMVVRQVSFYVPPTRIESTVFPDADDSFLEIVSFPVWLSGMWLMLLGGFMILLSLYRVWQQDKGG